MEMPLQYVKSQKGKDQLLYKGYLHKKERLIGIKTLWKCADYHKYHCTGRAHTCNDQVIKYVPHLHPPNKAAVEAKKVVCGAQKMGSSSQELAHKAAAASCSELPQAVTDKKPRVQNVKQTIQRLKARLTAARQATCGLQSSTTIAETGSKDQPLLSPVLSPNLQECPDGFMDRSVTATPTTSNKRNASHSSMIRASQEAGRQRFRLDTILPGEAPQEILSRLSEAAQQWLCPCEHDKDQIVDIVILEQFLNVLPVDIQAWVRAREPGNSKEAAQLAEACLREQKATKTTQARITFEDVSVHFTEEEWSLLEHEEKKIYCDVMHENYDNVAWLGDGTDSKDPWQVTPETGMKLSEKSMEEVSQSPEHDLVGKNFLQRQQQRSSGTKEENIVLDQSVLRKVLGDSDSEPGPEARCIWDDCENRDTSPTLIKSQRCPVKEDPESAVLSGKLHERFEKKGSQNLEQNFMCIGGEEQSEFPALVNNQKIIIGKDSECLVLSEDVLQKFAGIFQSPEQAVEPNSMHLEVSPTEMNGLTPFVEENQNSLMSQQANDCSHFCGLSASIKRRKFASKRKGVKRRNVHVKSSLDLYQGTDLGGKPKSDLKWENWRQCRCSPFEPGKGLRGPQALKHEQRSSSLPFLAKTATEPTMAQLMAVLRQVAIDTAEIKSSVTSLCITIAGIQYVLGNLSGCTDEAEHRISNLEDTSQNTKAQLVQHCNYINALEAKLNRKAVQTNIIAGYSDAACSCEKNEHISRAVGLSSDDLITSPDSSHQKFTCTRFWIIAQIPCCTYRCARGCEQVRRHQSFRMMMGMTSGLESSQFPACHDSGKAPQAYPPSRENSVGTQAETKAPLLVCLPASKKSHQQRFRLYMAPSGETPLETLAHLRDAAHQWLCPEECTKEQILDMVILEQFLAVLPSDLQIWLKAKEPSSSTEAAWLAETFLEQQKLADVTKPLSQCQRDDVAPAQKTFYWEVMEENYKTISSVAPWFSSNDLSRPKPSSLAELDERTLAPRRPETVHPFSTCTFSHPDLIKVDTKTEQVCQQEDLQKEEREILSCQIKQEEDNERDDEQVSKDMEVTLQQEIKAEEGYETSGPVSKGNIIPKSEHRGDIKSEHETENEPREKCPREEEKHPYHDGEEFPQCGTAAGATNTKPEKVPLVCFRCRKRFGSHALFISHLTSRKRSFVCPLCGKGFHFYGSCAGHLKGIHHNFKQRPKCLNTINNCVACPSHEKMDSDKQHCQKKLHCLKCGQHFDNEVDFAKHQYKHWRG